MQIFTEPISADEFKERLRNILGGRDADGNRYAQHEQYGRVIAETSLDLEQWLCDQERADQIQGAEERVLSYADLLFNDPFQDENRVLQHFWFRTACRVWTERDCPENWRSFLQVLGQGLQTAADTMKACEERKQHCDASGEETQILFPVAVRRAPNQNQYVGRLIAARVRTLNPSNDGEPALVRAPWSDFDLNDPNVLNNFYAELQQALGTVNPQWRERRLRFLVELALPTSACRYWNFNDNQRLALVELTPNTMTVDGDSLRLSIAIAAWATLSGLSVSPTVATGSLDGAGNINNVGYPNEKTNAVDRLREADNNAADAVNFIVPTTWPQNDAYQRFDSLNDLFGAPRILTDGFDALRRAYEQFPGEFNRGLETPKLGESTEQWTVLCTDFPLEGDETSTTPASEAIAQAVRWTHLQFQNTPMGDRNRQPIAIPIAFDRLVQLRETLTAKQKLGRVDTLHRWLQCVAEDLQELGPNKVSFQQLSQSLQHLRADAVEIAMNQQNKIIFFVWDQSADHFWDRPEGENQDKDFFKTYQTRVQLVTRSHAEQRLVMVCGDLRRKLAWEDSLRS